MNEDAQWSCAFYKALDFLQLKDGRDKVVLNRDDAAGFRLDTTYTHKQHTILADAEKPELIMLTNMLRFYRQHHICSWEQKAQLKFLLVL